MVFWRLTVGSVWLHSVAKDVSSYYINIPRSNLNSYHSRISDITETNNLLNESHFLNYIPECILSDYIHPNHNQICASHFFAITYWVENIAQDCHHNTRFSNYTRGCILQNMQLFPLTGQQRRMNPLPTSHHDVGFRRGILKFSIMKVVSSHFLHFQLIPKCGVDPKCGRQQLIQYIL
ncbi:Hypothetical_protein [Hexamita inflata]|uniref:Hypothetical_protein n=1 Tax=Hexamita inflata TaxID=28002 RepID=A0AA86R5D1_9EUKA|nr:Hypothetical protein HINF_LOCUS57312 [Hexamita inflata]